MLQKILKSKLILLSCVLILSVLAVGSLTSASQATGQETQPTAGSESIFLPVILNNYDATLGIPMFGTQMYGNTSNTNIYHTALLESNASWLRVPINWKSVEPVESEPAVYNWSSADVTFAAALPEMGRLNIIATIEKPPDWALVTYTDPAGEIIRTDKRDDFADFVAAAVERYDGDGIDDAPGSPIVSYWEIINEPDASAGSYPKWGNYGAEYAHLLSLVYPAVKAANPQVQLLIGGLAYDWFDDQEGNFSRSFLPDVLAAGGGNNFDIMNFHAYPIFAPNWTSGNGPGLLEKAEAVRSVLDSYGYSKPLVTTEAGWHDNSLPDLPSSPEIQARYIVQLFTQSYAAKLDIMIWWMLYDIGNNYPYDNGLVTLDDAAQVTEKISFKTFQEIAKELSTTHFVRKLPTSETEDSDFEVYEFSDNVRDLIIYVAWLDPVDTTTAKLLRLPASEAFVKESIPNQPGGNLHSYTVRDGDDGSVDGQITLIVGGRPLYVEIQR